jgi:hypothetical protein
MNPLVGLVALKARLSLSLFFLFVMVLLCRLFGSFCPSYQDETFGRKVWFSFPFLLSEMKRIELFKGPFLCKGVFEIPVWTRGRDQVESKDRGERDLQ